MNINFEINNIIFNYRAAAIIRNNNKLLVEKNKNVSHFTIPGGRCKIGENSINTVIRELKEETNNDCSFIKSIGIIENFYKSSYNNEKVHEILFIHELKFNKDNIYKRKIIKNIEEKHRNSITYEWIDIDILKTINFKPKIILDLLSTDKFQHLINNDS